MVTEANARLNLRTAAGNVAARLGVDPRNLGYDRQREYNRALAAEILKYPQSFTPEILTIAANIRDQGPQADTSFAWGDFFADAAVNSVPVLEGFTNKLLWILALVAVAWLVLNFPKGPRPTAA